MAGGPSETPAGRLAWQERSLRRLAPGTTTGCNTVSTERKESISATEETQKNTQVQHDPPHGSAARSHQTVTRTRRSWGGVRCSQR